jgi:glycosyltransferase involved in cell wall biosynthesis
MKVLFLTKYDNLAASSRLRAYQYKNKMDSSKFEVDVKSLFSNLYLEKKFNNRRVGFFYLAYLFLKRIFDLCNIRKYDSIIIHLELFPFLPPVFEWFLFKTNKLIYFDYDDAIYHNYDMSNNYFIKTFLSSKIKYLMSMADGVIAGNHYTEKYALNAGATNILTMPTVINIDSYVNKASTYMSEKNFTVGWIGSPSTSKYLEIVKEALIKLGEITPVTLYLVGANNKLNLSMDNVEIVSVEWSEKNEQTALREFDVGIMPLVDGPWELGKCAFKLIQYMASFLPVVSSNVGMNAEIIKNRGNGFLASSSDDWFNSLYKIYNDRDNRINMGIKGRDLIEASFTIQSRVSDFENFLFEGSDYLDKYVSDINLGKYANVSVIVPCFRCIKTIDRAIQSIVNQTVQPREVILVDDFSNDGTLEKLYELQQKYDKGWIRVINLNENLGPGSARNAGWDASTQNYIAFLDADDTWLPFKIAVQYSWMKNNHNVAMTGHYWSMCGEVNSEKFSFIKTTKIGKFAQLFQNNFTASSVMCTRSIKLRFEEGKYASEDFLLWCLIIFEGYNVYKTDKALSCIHKLPYGEGGLSGNLIAMELGALNSYKSLFIGKYISFFSFLFFSFFEFIKFLRRIISRAIGMKFLKKWVFP